MADWLDGVVCAVRLPLVLAFPFEIWHDMGGCRVIGARLLLTFGLLGLFLCQDCIIARASVGSLTFLLSELF